MSTAYSAASVIIPAQGGGGKAGTLYGWRPDVNQLQDIDVVRATTASRVNEAGLIEFVGVNVPRFDWGEGGSCPSLLVEPERTNLLLRSEEFDNGYWTKVSSTINANAATAPDGTATADEFISTSAQGLLAKFDTWNTNEQTCSVFVKANTSSSFEIYNATTGTGANFDLSSGIITSISSGFTASINQYSNNWYKVTVTHTAATSQTLGFRVTGLNESVYIWGAQLEEGSNPTSYIKTEASQETRNADVISKTGIASLIGQTEGTVYMEISFPEIIIQKFFSLSDGTSANRIQFGITGSGTFRLFSFVSSVQQSELSSPVLSPNQNYKIALKYAVNNFAIYIDGVKVATDLSGLTYSSGVLTNFNFSDPSGNAIFKGNVKKIAIYKTALTDQEAIALTTP